MKNLYTAFVLLMLMVFSCDSQDESFDETGYLNFNIDTRVSVVNGSRTIVDGYKPKQLRLEILDANKSVVASTNDYDNWKHKTKNLPLKAGRYTINVHSYGFDGNDSGFDIPYYAGSTEVIVEPGVLKTAEVVCTQANVKVTVNFQKSFMEAFKSAKAEVASAISGIAPLTFVMGETSASAYFPVGDLTSTVSVVNKFNKAFSQVDNFAKNVQPRSHYILNYKIAETGGGGVIVETDDEQRTYTFTFNVSTEASTQLGVDNPTVWSRFAVLKGEVLTLKEGIELLPQNMIFEYKQKSADMWTSVKANLVGETYNARVVGLAPNTDYVYRLVYRGAEEYASNEGRFKTEQEFALPNGTLDDWYKSGKTWYAASASDFSSGRQFWDSSNPGTTTGAAALVNINPTVGVTDVVHTPGGQSARMSSQFASAFGIGKFAAGSLYSGKFNSLVGTSGAKLDLGRPFTGRPTQLKGWFRYATNNITHVGPSQPAGTVTTSDQDLWSAYIALTTEPFTLDNTNLGATAKDYAKLLQDDKDNFLVAYGALPDEQCVTSGDWKEFVVNLTYKDLERKPTHIIIVISSSKYGDYFTGSDQSVLYIDDLELVYGDTPIVK